MSPKRVRDVAVVLKYIENVANGADPIEALHGHVCGPKCWHEQARQMVGEPSTWKAEEGTPVK